MTQCSTCAHFRGPFAGYLGWCCRVVKDVADNRQAYPWVSKYGYCGEWKA